MQSETLRKTENKMIFVEQDRAVSRGEIEEKLAVLREALGTGDDEVIRKAMKRVVPTYHSPRKVNEAAVKGGRLEEVADGKDTGALAVS